MKLVAALFVAAVVGLQKEPRDERLYGRVTTESGSVFEGFLRWDRNEANWADFLDGQKEIPWEHLEQAEDLDPEYAARRQRERSIEAFGVRITWDRDDSEGPTMVTSAVRFGHLSALVVLDARRARLDLKSGGSVELRSSSTDLGRRMRGLVVEDRDRGDVTLDWRDLERIDFMPAPSGAPAPDGERLYGTLTTETGHELTGFVAWDLDEVYKTDILDGRNVDDRNTYELPFSEIAAIEWESSRSARVILESGGEVVLRGTNDVDRDNRGIEISDPAWGRAIVPWEEFRSILFHSSRAGPASYETFRGGSALTGTVETRGGERFTGAIRWDNDEAEGWEVLDGWSDGVEYDIELSAIQSIRKAGMSSVDVTLLDGRTFELDGSNDVNRDNKGIFVTDAAGQTVLVHWSDFERVVFRW